MQVPTVWSRYLRQMVRYFDAHGAERQRLLDRLGVDEELLDDVHARLPVTTFYEAIELAITSSGNPYIALDFITECGLSSYEAVGYLALAHKTFGEATEAFFRHHRRLFENDALTYELRGERILYSSRPPGADRLGRATYIEMCALACLRSRLKDGKEIFTIPMLRLGHGQRPGTTLEEYRTRFGRVPEFHAPANEWALPRIMFDLPMPSPNPLLVAFFEEYLKDVTVPREESFAVRVRETLERSLESGVSTLEQVAKRLHLSVRTLQRGLAQEERSFEDIIKDVRRRRSFAYLDAGVPLGEISYLLGYATPSSFHRAFVRWTGVSPAQWKARSTNA